MQQHREPNCVRIAHIKRVPQFGEHLNAILEQLCNEVGPYEGFVLYQCGGDKKMDETKAYIKLKNAKNHGKMCLLLHGYEFHGTSFSALPGYHTFDREHIYEPILSTCKECNTYKVHIRNVYEDAIQREIVAKQRAKQPSSTIEDENLIDFDHHDDVYCGGGGEQVGAVDKEEDGKTLTVGDDVAAREEEEKREMVSEVQERQGSESEEEERREMVRQCETSDEDEEEEGDIREKVSEVQERQDEEEEEEDEIREKVRQCETSDEEEEEDEGDIREKVSEVQERQDEEEEEEDEEEGEKKEELVAGGTREGDENVCTISVPRDCVLHANMAELTDLLKRNTNCTEFPTVVVTEGEYTLSFTIIKE